MRDGVYTVQWIPAKKPSRVGGFFALSACLITTDIQLIAAERETAGNTNCACGATTRIGSKLRHIIAVLLTALFLGACQSSPATDVLENVAEAPPTPTREGAASETVGTGPVMVSMLIHTGGGGTGAARAADFRDGAAFAVKELGADSIKLAILDTNGESEATRAAALKAIETGAAMIVGPTTSSELAALAAVPATGRPPILGLTTNAVARAQGIFALLSDETDSAIEVSRHAAANGKRRVFVIAPPGYQAANGERLRRGLEASGAELVDLIEYVPGSRAIDNARQRLEQSDALLVMGLPTNPVAVIEATKKTGSFPQDGVVMGTSGWSRQLYANAALSGVLLALPNQEAMQETSKRFQSSYGRPLSVNSAYAYDALALAAGIVRARGAKAINSAALRSKSGFRGASGIFRFGSDGSIERLFPIYTLSDRQLKLVENSPEGF